jgi:hypothetical protein
MRDKWAMRTIDDTALLGKPAVAPGVAGLRVDFKRKNWTPGIEGRMKNEECRIGDEG